MNKTVVARIKSLIKEKGMIQRVVAERSGFTAQQFTDMLYGRKIIRAEYLPRIAAVLGVDVKELFGAEQTEGGGERGQGSRKNTHKAAETAP